MSFIDPMGLFTWQFGPSVVIGGGSALVYGTGVAIAWNPEKPFKIELGTYQYYGVGSHMGYGISASVDLAFQLIIAYLILLEVLLQQVQVLP